MRQTPKPSVVARSSSEMRLAKPAEPQQEKREYCDTAIQGLGEPERAIFNGEEQLYQMITSASRASRDLFVPGRAAAHDRRTPWRSWAGAAGETGPRFQGPSSLSSQPQTWKRLRLVSASSDFLSRHHAHTNLRQARLRHPPLSRSPTMLRRTSPSPSSPASRTRRKLRMPRVSTPTSWPRPE